MFSACVVSNGLAARIEDTSRIKDTVSDAPDAKFRHIELPKTVTNLEWELSPIQQMSFQFFRTETFSTSRRWLLARYWVFLTPQSLRPWMP